MVCSEHVDRAERGFAGYEVVAVKREDETLLGLDAMKTFWCDYNRVF